MRLGAIRVLLNIFSMTLAKSVGTRASLDASSLWRALSIQLCFTSSAVSLSLISVMTSTESVRYSTLRERTLMFSMVSSVMAYSSSSPRIAPVKKSGSPF